LWLFAAIRLCCGANLGLRLMRWLMISIYCYSALGKFDFEFLHSVGQQMLGALAKLLGQDLSAMPNWLRLGLVAAFPLCEFAIAIGLAMPKSRRVFGFFAIGLHLSLILVLGPFGLGHRLGVLLWNIQFAVQAYFLFVVRQCACDGEILSEQLVAPEGRKHTFSPGHCIGLALIAMVIVMPITERFGIWDHWPSWALYAPHSSRVRIEVAPSAIARLPAGLGVLIDKSTAEADELPDWVAVPIDAWSLSSLDTPIYPQSRFQLGVAKQIASEVSSEFQIRITLLGCANRFTGLRKSEVIEGTSKIVDAGAGFWFNTRPRWRAGK